MMVLLQFFIKCELHLQLGDINGQATAQVNIMDLKKMLGIEADDLSPESEKLIAMAANQVQPSPGIRRYRVRRKSMEHLDLIKVVVEASFCFILVRFIRTRFVLEELWSEVEINYKVVPANLRKLIRKRV